MKSFRSLLFVACISLLLLGGCSSQKTTPPVIQETSKQSALKQFSAEQLLKQAEQKEDPSKRTLLLLTAAEKFYQRDQAQSASATLNNIEQSPDALRIGSQNLFRLVLLNLKLGVYAKLPGHQESAIKLFSNDILERVNIDDIKEMVPLLAEAFHLQGQPIDGAVLLAEYSGILSNGQEYSYLNEQIWTLLRSSEAMNLSSYDYSGNDKDALAWLELARTISENQMDLESQFQALSEWQVKWPSHPATAWPPKELKLLSNLPETRPSSIILALPFSGPVEQVGKAVRDGFMAAYYDSLNQQGSDSLNQQGNDALKISFFDTNKQTIEELLQTASTDKDLIIGPLTKPEVNKLRYLELNQRSVLALNYLDNVQTDTVIPLPKRLYQFGLNPDIEVTQLAELFKRKRHHKIAFIGPETDLGFRLYDALRIELQKNGSRIIESVFYKEQNSLSNSVAQLLGTDQSKQRKRDIQSITGLNVEFEPRRRQDIDAIFMLAKPSIAKQLNPLFAYHYGGDLPIYSSSQVHQIEESKQDLDNIYFVDMPWMLSNTIDVKNSISAAIPSAASQYTRFYALGADAYALAPRLRLLKNVKDSHLQGHTGTLSINPEGVVDRKLEVAAFKKGRAVVIKE